MKAFFKSTRDAGIEFTILFDFIWTTMPALWNLRWQVNGFLGEAPNTPDAELLARFVLGSDVHGTNLRKACAETTWEAQRQLFASIVLTNAFSIYEHWADEILAELKVNNVKGKGFQFSAETGLRGLPGAVSLSLCYRVTRTAGFVLPRPEDE